jgi:ribose transport system substrate-binding protein
MKKRLLAMLLVLLLVFSMATLAACGEKKETQVADETETVEKEAETEVEEEEEETVTEEMLANSLPKEYMREKVAAGQEVTIAFCTPSLSSDLMVAMDNGMREQFGAEGFNYISSAFNADSAKLIEQLENYVTMGCSAIITLIFDNGMADTAAKVTDAGIFLILWSFNPEFPVSMAMISDESSLGAVAADMALTWVEQQYPDAGAGEVKAALLGCEMNQTYIERFDGIRDELATNDKVEIVYYDSDDSMEVNIGFDFAEAALTYDPEIRLFISMTSSEATGINNYVVSKFSGEELLEFAAFGTDNDSASRELIDTAGAGGESILRGLVGSGTDNPADYVVKYILGLIDGEYEEGCVVHTPQYSYDCVGFNYDER